MQATLLPPDTSYDDRSFTIATSSRFFSQNRSSNRKLLVNSIRNLLTFERKADEDIREGRFQRSLALIAAGSGLLSGMEVAYEHYRGSYSRRIMYTPVVLSAALTGAGVAAFKSKSAARTVLPVVSWLTLLDCVIGFGFHIRGIHRKPGGWRVPVVNIVMGPPLFAPLLFGTAAYLGVVAVYLRREDDPDKAGWPLPAHREHWAARLHRKQKHEKISWEQDAREGRFQKHMAAAAALSAVFSGFEAWYSHYKNNFQYKVQWTPLVVAPALAGAAVAAIYSKKAAHTWLPAMSALAIANGSIGFFYHARGVKRRPGGLKMPLYNIMYGPPIFAPLLFASAGFLGLLASLLRREEQ